MFFLIEQLHDESGSGRIRIVQNMFEEHRIHQYFWNLADKNDWIKVDTFNEMKEIDSMYYIWYDKEKRYDIYKVETSNSYYSSLISTQIVVKKIQSYIVDEYSRELTGRFEECYLPPIVEDKVEDDMTNNVPHPLKMIGLDPKFLQHRKKMLRNVIKQRHQPRDITVIDILRRGLPNKHIFNDILNRSKQKQTIDNDDWEEINVSGMVGDHHK